MPAPFSRTLLALEASSPRRSLPLLALVALLLGLWSTWFFGARVAVLEVSVQARIEVEHAAYPIAAPVGGRVVAHHGRLGDRIQAGDLLVELDAESERRKRDEAGERVSALEPQCQALADELVSRQEMLAAAHDAGQSALLAARAKAHEARLGAQYSRQESRMYRALEGGDTVPDLAILHAHSQRRQARSAAQALGFDVRRLESDLRLKESEAHAALAELQRRRAELDGELKGARVLVRLLDLEIEKHHIRAPAAGRIGELAALQVGAVLREGANLGTVVPDGGLKVVAEFSPQATFGHIRSGQPAQMRLDGFPWTQYGTVAARVTSVAAEARDGAVRVELAVLGRGRRPIPLAHGMPGHVEIEVTQASPAALLLRAAGRALGLSTPGAP